MFDLLFIIGITDVVVGFVDYLAIIGITDIEVG